MWADSPASPVRAWRRKTRGTYLGLIEKIPYLKELGVTAVELLPVQQFDEQDVPPAAEELLGGYNPVASLRRIAATVPGPATGWLR